MVAVEKQLEASQRFLAGVRALDSYEEIQQRQVKGLVLALGKCKDLSTSQAAAFLEGIDPSLWSETAVEELQQLVAAKTSQVEVDGQRRPMQDFSQILHFLTPELQTMILERKATSDQLLQALCIHAARLSLRVPSEATIAVFVTVANWSQIEHGMTDKGKFLFFQQQKSIVRRHLLAAGDVTNVLGALPMDFASLPQNLGQAAFGDRLPVDMADTGVAMMQAARMMPLRLTNRSVSRATTCRQLEESTAEWTARAINAAVQGAVAASHSLGNGSGAATAAGVPVPPRVAETRSPEILALTNAPRGKKTGMATVPADVPGCTGLNAGATPAPEALDTAALGDVEAQHEALRQVAPKAKAKGKATSSKKPASNLHLKRPAAAMTPADCAESKGSIS
eukprot:s19_g38.t1